jgi:putative GTP pyrophosphokinase
VAFPKPLYTRGQVNKAGEIIRAAWAVTEDPIAPGVDPDSLFWAYEVLGNWRACHNYPINTFQATLRNRLKTIDRDATVAQRLKRLPSIIMKLLRFPHMELARMQDIGGLRAIVESVAEVRKLEKLYLESKFQHQLVAPHKNYIQHPKSDGYRGIHLVYKYQNELEPAYDGLQLELQLRTRLQHAWATAVETMGTFLGQALKSGQGEGQWRAFFEVSGAAIALLEKCPPVPGYEKLSETETFEMVAEAEAKLHVLEKLRGFSVAADSIKTEKGQGAYHLVVLDSANKSVVLTPYPISRLDEANAAYSKVEKRTQAGEPIEAVLVAAGPVEALKKAYPNYFLDTHQFIRHIEGVIQEAGASRKSSSAAHDRPSARRDNR